MNVSFLFFFWKYSLCLEYATFFHLIFLMTNAMHTVYVNNGLLLSCSATLLMQLCVLQHNRNDELHKRTACKFRSATNFETHRFSKCANSNDN